MLSSLSGLLPFTISTIGTLHYELQLCLPMLSYLLNQSLTTSSKDSLCYELGHQLVTYLFESLPLTTSSKDSLCYERGHQLVTYLSESLPLTTSSKD